MVKYNIGSINQTILQTLISRILNLWLDMPVGRVTMILVNQLKYPTEQARFTFGDVTAQLKANEGVFKSSRTRSYN
jgi:hypothetical protein